MQAKSFKEAHPNEPILEKPFQPSLLRKPLIYLSKIIHVPLQMRRLVMRQFCMIAMHCKYRKEKTRLFIRPGVYIVPRRNFKRFKFIKRLELHLKPLSDFNRRNMGCLIKYQTRLTHLTMLCHDLRFNPMKELQSQKFLQYLNFTFRKAVYSYLEMKRFKKAMKTLKKLTTIIAVPKESPFAFQEKSKFLDECRYSMTDLRVFKLELPYFRRGTSFLKSFQTFLKHHPKIEVLSRKFEGEELLDQDFMYLKESIKSLYELRSLTTNFVWCNMQAKTKLELFEYKRPLIQVFNFGLYNSYISHENLIMLIRNFAYLECLKSFSIKIFNCSFAEAHLIELNKTLTKFKYLESFDLIIEYTFYIGPTILQNSLTVLENSKIGLRALSLDLNSKAQKFQDNELLAISDSISRFLNLNSLHFKMHEFFEITDYGLEGFYKTIGKLTNLTSLSLDLKKKPNITDHSTEIFKTCLSRLSKLQMLSLSFFQCDLTEKSCKYLSESVESLKKLETLSLAIVEMKINDEGMFYIKRLLERLETLRELTLNLSLHYKEEGLKSLAEGLGTLKLLSKLRIKTDSCEFLSTGETIDILKQGITILPRLKELRWELSDYLTKFSELQLYEKMKNLEYFCY